MAHGLLKAALRSMAAQAYWASPHFLASLAGKVLILTYHRVIPRADVTSTFVQPGMYVTPETFEHHLRFLTAHFELVTFHDLLARWEGKTWGSTTRYCAITFDDGWLDNYLYAYPLLRAHGVPATIFLPTDLIGTTDWFWPDRLGYLLRRLGSRDAPGVRRNALASLVRHYPRLATVNGQEVPDAVDSLIEATKTISDEARDELLRGLEHAAGGSVSEGRRLLNWDEVREMSSHGIAFGSHSCTHAILTRLDYPALERELRQPLQALREQRVNDVSVLSYPNGNHTSAVVAAAQAAGYRAAVTTRVGLESSQPTDLFRLRRIGVHDDVSRSIPLFTFHVARQAW